MSLPYVLLGVLSWEPMTGYEIKKKIDVSTQLFWHAELSQIYPSLKQLEKEGLVTVESITQENKPDKRIYSITQAGRVALANWLKEPLDEIPAIKNLPLLRLFFSGVLQKEEILSQLRFQLGAHQARLQRIQQDAPSYFQAPFPPGKHKQEEMMWELVRQLGVLQTQTIIEWLENAIHVVENSQDPLHPNE